MYITSTMTSDVSYAIYEKLPGGVMKIIRTIEVRGGANVTDPKTLVTPRGVATEISEQDYILLEKNPVFQMHKKNGYINVIKESINKYEAQELAEDPKDLEQKDASAQVTKTDYEKKGKKTPRVKKDKGE